MQFGLDVSERAIEAINVQHGASALSTNPLTDRTIYQIDKFRRSEFAIRQSEKRYLIPAAPHLPIALPI